MKIRLAAAAFCVLLAGPPAAWAQDDAVPPADAPEPHFMNRTSLDQGNAMEGAALAGMYCAGCHVVSGSGRGADVGPSFKSIANDPERTDGTLAAWLNDPHPPMPNMGLSAREIADVIAYIRTLGPAPE